MSRREDPTEHLKIRGGGRSVDEVLRRAVEERDGGQGLFDGAVVPDQSAAAIWALLRRPNIMRMSS